MKYILAIDSFKGCLSSSEAEAAVENAIREAVSDADVVCLPVSDGGEGMLDAFLSLSGGSRQKAFVHDA